jgi:germination protein M
MHARITRPIGAVAVVAALSFTTACASSTRSGQQPATTTAPPAVSTTGPPSTTAVPSTTTPPISSTTVPAPATTDVRVYFLHGDKIDVAHRSVTATPQIATAAMTQLLAGPTSADTAAGLASAIPSSTRLLGISIARGVATVDLTGPFASGGGSLSMAGRLAQVTYTLTQFPTISSVVFRLDGKAVTVFGGEGIILDHPATRSGFESLTPPILVEFPGRGWTVHSPVRLSGSANVFEAQFQAEITDSSGRVIASQSIHASAGTGTRGTFATSISFPNTAGGRITLTVFDASPKDGSRIDVVTIPLVLTGG